MFFGKHRYTNKALHYFGQADNSGQVLGTRSPLVFMRAAEDDWVGQQRRLDEQSACPLGPVQLVRADGYQIRVELVNARKRFFAKPLHCVGVEEDSALAANGP